MLQDVVRFVLKARLSVVRPNQNYYLKLPDVIQTYADKKMTRALRIKFLFALYHFASRGNASGREMLEIEI